jgi:hypothetical protein
MMLCSSCRMSMGVVILESEKQWQHVRSQNLVYVASDSNSIISAWTDVLKDDGSKFEGSSTKADNCS